MSLATFWKRALYLLLESATELVELFIALQTVAWSGVVINPFTQRQNLISPTANFLGKTLQSNPIVLGYAVFVFGILHVIMILIGKAGPRRFFAMSHVIFWSFIVFSIVALDIRYPPAGTYTITALFSAICFLRIHK